MVSAEYIFFRYIKLSSPKLNNIAVIGCILVYLAVVLLGVDHATLPSEKYFTVACTVSTILRYIVTRFGEPVNYL